MGKTVPILVSAAAICGVATTAFAQSQPDENMGFFVTSTNPGKGGDLGGIAGADAHCQSLADAVGADNMVWRAYLSTSAQPGFPAINARDRIGPGPWHNVEGVKIAEDVDDLHSDNNKLTKETALTELGEIVPGRGETPNLHDVLTGSNLAGRAYSGTPHDMTCDNWTSSGEGNPMVGHTDRQGGGPNANSWHSVHPARGCSMEGLAPTGGDGKLYCFAAARLPMLSVVLHEGEWESGRDPVAGTWRIEQEGDVTYVALGDGFKTREAADLKIYLSPRARSDLSRENATEGSFVVAPLEIVEGAQRFALPAGFDLASYKSIFIYCEVFSAFWGSAALT